MHTFIIMVDYLKNDDLQYSYGAYHDQTEWHNGMEMWSNIGRLGLTSNE